MVKSAKIFWMSDIHYCHITNNKIESINDKVKGSSRNHTIEKYFESVRNRIIEEKPTHIVITGDLAFSGEYEQYKGMYNSLLKDYLESDDGKDTRLTICCGNHCSNRSIIHDPNFKREFLNAIDTKDLNKYSDKLEVLKKLEELDLDIDRFSVIAKQSANEGTSLFNKLKKDQSIPKLKASELLFLGYRDFYTDFVQPRFDTINKKSNNIIQYEIDKNQGLYGVVHDREYNLIFTVLNSAWMAWGSETYDKLLTNTKTNSEFNEYGNLTYKIDVLTKLQSIFNINLASQLGNNITICLSHHPFSWMSYEDNYVYNSLNEVMKQQDIILTGHVHVPHSLPTLYKGRTYWMEAPQIFDYHLYDDHIGASNQYGYIKENHGFSLLDLSPDLKSWGWKPYSLSSVDERNRQFHPFDIGQKIEWKLLDEFEKEFDIKSLKKPMPSITDLIGNDMNSVEWEKYNDYCKYNATANGASKDTGGYLRIKESDIYINLDSYLKSLPHYSTLTDLNLKYRDRINDEQYDQSFKLMFDNNKSVIYIVPNFNFNQDYNKLIDFIAKILSKNSHNVKIIHILFFDYQIIEYFYTDLGTTDIVYINKRIASWFDRIKVAIVNKCGEIDISGIAFDEKVVVLPQYIKHICS